MKKILLTVLILSTFYFLLSTAPVLAKCTLSITDNTPGCVANQTCRYDYFYPDKNLAGQVCADLSIGNCWCTPNDPNSTPPPIPTLPPFPTGSTPPTLLRSGGSCSTGSTTTDSRPNVCETCTQTSLLTPACAQTFSGNDEVKFRTSRADFMCASGGPEQAWIKESWGGTAKISFNDEKTGQPLTKIPFVGKKGQEDEQKYLADYFEGTQYYKPQLDLSTCTICQTDPQSSDCQTCQRKLQDIILTAGVWRKLAPEQLQNDYKKQMIERAKTGNIHDYQVEHNNESARLTEFSGHLPPDANDPAYSSWQQSKWGKLWPAVPMFSREDTPGEVKATVGTLPKPYDIVEPDNPVLAVEKVPHLARLYEVTKAIQQLLVPEEIDKNTTEQVLGTSTLLAQAGCVALEAGIEVVSQNPFVYAIVIKRTSCAPPGTLGDIHINPPAGMVNSGPHVESMTGNELRFQSNYAGAEGFMPQVKNAGELKQLSWTFRADRLPEGYKISDNVLFSYQGDGTPPPKPTPVPVCGLPGPASVPDCRPQDALSDPGGDVLCCDDAGLKISATDTLVNTFYPDYQKNYGNCMGNCLSQPGMSESKCDNLCDPEKTKTVSRQIGLTLQHPYLDQIWQQTTDSLTGFLNIFNAQGAFEDLPAATKINYRFTPNGSSDNTADPKIGDFYFPHLGGIQKAKEFVINLLNPQGTSQSSSGGGVTASPTPTPKPVNLDYTIPYRDSSTISISADLKKRIIANVHANGNWNKTKIDSSFDFVYNQAVANGWNPAFVIALWIEESGAGAFDSAYALGCEGASKTDLAGQLNCLFTRPYADKSFEEFMCRYSDGHYPCDFSGHPNFVNGIKTWYNCTIGVRCPYE